MTSKPISKMSFLEFQKRFTTEEACIDHLERMKWPQGFICPHCGADKYYRIAGRQLYQCTACRHQTSITAGTVMHKSKLELRQWFWAIYLCATDKRGLSAKALQLKIGVSYPTAWFLLHKIRAAMADRDSLYKLCGAVEADDAYIGGRSKSTPGTGDKSGRGTDKTPIVVALSFNDKGKPAFLKISVLENVTKEELGQFFTDTVETTSHVYTDALAAYNQLDEMGIRHTAKVYKKVGPEYLKYLHTIISNLKAFIDGTYHGLSKAHIQSYIDEFCYRFNRRWDPNGIFDRLSLAVLSGSHLPWKSLVPGQQSVAE